MARRKTITRDQILTAAHQVISEKGFSHFTARNIATQMNCSTQPIYLEFKNMNDLKEEAKKLKIDAVILAVTKEHAQIVADRIIMSGIHAILNMTTYKLEVPKGVAVMNIDISAKLQELNYWRKEVKFDKTK
mgnify:CR=1 FL=1